MKRRLASHILKRWRRNRRTLGFRRQPCIECLEPRRLLSTLVVNTVQDGADLRPGDGICDTGIPPQAPSGLCTLKAAVAEANAHAGRDTIAFDLAGSGPHVIRLDVASGGFLPPITEPVVIDGYTQHGAQPNTEPAPFGWDTHL